MNSELNLTNDDEGGAEGLKSMSTDLARFTAPRMTRKTTPPCYQLSISDVSDRVTQEERPELRWKKRWRDADA